MTNEINNSLPTHQDNSELLSESLKLIEEALTYLLQIKNCSHASAIITIVHGLIALGESVYQTYKNK